MRASYHVPARYSNVFKRFGGLDGKRRKRSHDYPRKPFGTLCLLTPHSSSHFILNPSSGRKKHWSINFFVLGRLVFDSNHSVYCLSTRCKSVKNNILPAGGGGGGDASFIYFFFFESSILNRRILKLLYCWSSPPKTRSNADPNGSVNLIVNKPGEEIGYFRPQATLRVSNV